MLKICQTLLMTIYNITSAIVYDKVSQWIVIKWTDKINHLGHIINHGDDDCL